MKHIVPLLALALLAFSACEPTTSQDNTREVEKRERAHDIIPVDTMDDALRTEGVAASSIIVRQCQAALIRTYNGDAGKLAADVGGKLNATKLKKLGIAENELKGTNYMASDYNLKFSGKSLTIEASKPGTRGWVSETFTLR